MYERIKESFNKQGLMQTLNAQLLEVEKGQVKIACKFTEGLTQQHGFFHAGVLTSIADNACDYEYKSVHRVKLLNKRIYMLPHSCKIFKKPHG